MTTEPTYAEILHRYEALTLLGSDSEHIRGRAWYRQNATAVCLDLGYPNVLTPEQRRQALLVASILSPQLSWEKNVEAARACYQGKSRPRGVIESFWAKACTVDSAPLTVHNVDYVARYISPKTAPKTFNFALALIDPNGDHCVIDRHMFDAAFLTKGAHEDPWCKRRGSYDLCAKALAELGARQQIPASAVQATVWLVWKSMTNRRSENGKNPMEKMS